MGHKIIHCKSNLHKLFYTPGDGSEIIYVNGEYRDITTALGRLISDFHCADPSDMHSDVLAKRAKFLKSDAEEVTKMCKSVEEYAEKKSIADTVKHLKVVMKKLNLSAEKALDFLEIPKADFPKYLAAL